MTVHEKVRFSEYNKELTECHGMIRNLKEETFKKWVKEWKAFVLNGGVRPRRPL